MGSTSAWARQPLAWEIPQFCCLSGTDSAPTGGALVSLLFLVTLQHLLLSSTQQWDQV